MYKEFNSMHDVRTCVFEKFRLGKNTLDKVIHSPPYFKMYDLEQKTSNFVVSIYYILFHSKKFRYFIIYFLRFELIGRLEVGCRLVSIYFVTSFCFEFVF